MFAIKLFGLLMAALFYVVITGFWFAYGVPPMFEVGSVPTLLVAAIGTFIWLTATGCIAIHIIKKVRPA
ncbi:hypothetical protein [Pseudomonas purpurea]|uniref:hypothetical protein n=1 Tax=Pseudomonas purpurea TaxID=3136737 RepID=UPI003263ADF7